MPNLNLHGIIAYPVTPFKDSGETIDTDTLSQLIEQLIENGSHAIAPLGSTGESAYLSDAEWEEVAFVSIHQVAKRVPTVVGISELTTHNAIRRAKFAEQVGADAVMVLPISYWKLSEREVFQHYAAIAQAISIPIMVYNNPATSGIDLSPELIARMVKEIDNVTMVKESTGDIQRMHRLYELSDGTIPFYNGSNPLALEAFVAGASGWCTAAHNLIPEFTTALYEFARKGNLFEAQRIFYQQLPLLKFILKGGLPTTIKAGLQLLGIKAGTPRLPMLPLDEAEVRQLDSILTRLSKKQLATSLSK